MKKKIMAILMAISAFAVAEDNRAGLGVFYKTSKYEGGEGKTYPFFNLKYENAYLQGSEIGYNIEKDNYTINPFLKKETTEGFEKGELDGINSLLEERKNPLLAGLRVKKDCNNLDLELSAYRDFTSDGNNAELKASYTLEIFRFLYFLPSASLVYSDKNYTKYFYGITEEEAMLTGNAYKELNASFRTQLEMGLALFFSEKAGIYFSYNMEILDKDNYNGSLIKDSVNESYTLMGMYRF